VDGFAVVQNPEVAEPPWSEQMRRAVYVAEGLISCDKVYILIYNYVYLITTSCHATWDARFSPIPESSELNRNLMFLLSTTFGTWESQIQILLPRPLIFIVFFNVSAYGSRCMRPTVPKTVPI